MNFFELIVSDPSAYQQVVNDFTPSLRSWTLFKQNIASLFLIKNQEADLFLVKSKEMWNGFIKNSKELLPVMIDYYISIK
jgi:hypothetical protein